MSDITKKIFSIEQTGDSSRSSEPSTSDVVRSFSEAKAAPTQKPPVDNVPEFVTREPIRPLAAPPSPAIEEPAPSKAGGWAILGFAFLYFIGAGLYFGLPLIGQPVGLIPIAGLALLLLLPLILLLLLWRALRHLTSVSQQNLRLSQAAEILVTPDQEALDRTETLASGIRDQISLVNKGLSDTVEALKGVQIGVARESQALDAAGLALANRSDDVGRNLTLQRQALEGMSGTFDTRMSTLSTQITDTSQTLDGICSVAETKLLNASEALQKACATVDETVTTGAASLGENITSLGDASRKLEETGTALTADLTDSSQTLLDTDTTFTKNAEKLQALNTQTQAQISDLQATIGHGYEMLAELQSAAETRASTVSSYYDELSTQLKRSEDDTLAAQGQTARMVETNLAQMRRDFSRMETDMKALQTKLGNLRDVSEQIPHVEPKPSRLNLTPLDSDFPPVEPPRPVVRAERVEIADSPLNLGMDMEIESVDEPLINFEPDIITRPGDANVNAKGKGFGRRNGTEDKSGWRWRDMLETLDPPDSGADLETSPSSFGVGSVPGRKIDGVALLTRIQFSPAAIVDDGIVIDATQARIKSGEAGLSSTVYQKLPEAVAHLKNTLEHNPALRDDLWSFTVEFSKMIGNTPPTAPGLRAALGSPDGRAYLLCAAAFRPELRG